MDFTDKTVIITGAASGIGKKMSESLYEKGCRVVLCDIREDELRRLYSHYEDKRTLRCKLDVRNVTDWQQVREAVIKNFTTVDYLLNIAGVLEAANIYESSIEKIDRQIDINLKGTMYGDHTFSPVMIAQKHGQIINIASMAGLAPIQGMNSYSASKFGVRGFSLAAAYELREHGVKVSVLCPDAVHTPMLDKQKDEKAAAMTYSTRLLLTVEDIEKAILSLMVKPKFEKWLPVSRGILATIGSLFPSVALLLKDKLIRRGLKQQALYIPVNNERTS
jgi:3-oxoacyl-[acyl-carrier protein] reductase